MFAGFRGLRFHRLATLTEIALILRSDTADPTDLLVYHLWVAAVANLTYAGYINVQLLGRVNIDARGAANRHASFLRVQVAGVYFACSRRRNRDELCATGRADRRGPGRIQVELITLRVADLDIAGAAAL